MDIWMVRLNRTKISCNLCNRNKKNIDDWASLIYKQIIAVDLFLVPSVKVDAMQDFICKFFAFHSIFIYLYAFAYPTFRIPINIWKRSSWFDIRKKGWQIVFHVCFNTRM